MPSICLFFQVHQPRRLRRYTVFDIDQRHDYENEALNREVLHKVSDKCYLPASDRIVRLLRKYEGDFRVAFSLTGTLIEQLESERPDVLESFQRMNETGCVEWLNGTYDHSLASLYSPAEFREQVQRHHAKIDGLFGQKAVTFCNTEMIYNNDIARAVGEMGYQVILTEGADRILPGGDPWISCRAASHPGLAVLLRHYRLSDDISFRFSATDWFEYPLTAKKYAGHLSQNGEAVEVINLFMDYETFGEHHWSETGIFDFLWELPGEILKYPDFRFATPAQIIPDPSASPLLDVEETVSWADSERDVTAWTGNGMQRDALRCLFQMEDRVKQSGDDGFLKVWRMLQTSDHFYYMCTKRFADGDVHRYFNPWGSPYDAYISYMNILDDFDRTLHK
ncbi:MAG TPA: glycoside hydrolase family 57 protein [Syntrophales bacterium]|jgi:alpha-amylase|nr:glycoside hydrolase family 57 protein [Syntrophales bacterium]HQA82009.1 glycoside hydrolase family 57 protein [Syntrophales bacterium]